MHIEPGIVDSAKIGLSYATATGAAAAGLNLCRQSFRNDGGLTGLAGKSLATTALVFSFFQLLPHAPVGVSEVHFILGSTLFLLFGAGAASIGLAMGLLLQGVLVAPFDLPQYGMNVTTLLAPLWATSLLARRIIDRKTAYADLSYAQTLALSTTFQAGIVAWVAFWAFYGGGFTAASIASVSLFASAYLPVILIESVADMGILTIARTLRDGAGSPLFNQRLFQAAG